MPSIVIKEGMSDRYFELIALLDSVKKQIEKQMIIAKKLCDKFFDINNQLNIMNKKNDDDWDKIINGIADEFDTNEIIDPSIRKNLIDKMNETKKEIDSNKQITAELYALTEPIHAELKLIVICE
jgi:hypothetical protein